MSDIMRPIPFAQMMDWILTENAEKGSIFGIRKIVRHEGGAEPIFAEKIETPFGPAAGPNSQLTQNIVASYVAGARFFELKTVQVMDGEELSRCVAKPCIVAEDECYNCEWSTELEVPQAMAEYIKAWWACKLLARELGLGDPDGFVFNMSVGYDLYLRLLGDAIREQKGEKPVENLECLVDIQIEAHIPEKYIPSLAQRIDIYKKIAAIRTEDDWSDTMDELCDRFGEPPRSVAGLLDVALIRSRAAALGIREIDQRVGSLLFYSDRIDRGDLLALTKALPGRVLMNAGAKPYLTVKLQKGSSWACVPTT